MSLPINPSSDPIGTRNARVPVPLYWVTMAGATLVLAAALLLNPAPADGPVASVVRTLGLAGLGLLTLALLWLGFVPPSPRTDV